MTWHEVSLKQICAVDWGNTKLTKSSYVANGKFLAVSAAGADGLIDHYEHEADVPVLSAIGAQCGRMFYPGERFTAIKNTITLTPKEDMADGKFLYYLFTHVELPQRGAGQPFISKGDIEAFRVSIPQSLEEQRKIVEKLDSAFAEIDLLERNLGVGEEKANQLLNSLLSSAFYSDEDENGTNNPSNNQLTVRKLVSLGTVAQVIAGQSPEGIYYNSNGDGAPFYQGKKEFGDKFLGAPTTWTTKVTKLAQSGDILMSVRAPVGPINFSTQEICIGRGLASIRASKSVDKEFLYYFLLHKQPEISGNTGAVFDSINKEQIASIEIPVPPLEKQREIVEMLDSSFTEVELLKGQIRTKKNFASALRQSLLSNAFTQEEEVA
jgi:type I restriction enzyme S subunit